MPAWLESALTSVATFVPQLALFLVILVVGWIVARVLRKVVDALLERVRFDAAVQRGGLGSAMANAKYDASDLVALLVYYAVLLITFQLAFGIFGANPVSQLLTDIVAFLPRIVVAIVIVVIASAIAAAVKDLVTGVLGGLSYGRVLGTVASVFVIGLGVIAALSQIGVAIAVTLPVLITVLATVGGILVVGVGGGLIGPMRTRWEGWLSAAEQETRAATPAATPAPVATSPAANGAPTQEMASQN